MKVVIVGGGFAGVKAALQLKNKTGFEVVLISMKADFEYHSALYRSATGHSPLEVVFRLGDIFKGATNIEVILDKIVAINTKVFAVKGEGGQIYRYDKLLICMGNESNFYHIPGLDTYAHTMYTIKDTIELRSQLIELLRTPRRSKVRVIVIGAGASGVELCGDLQAFAHTVSERYSIAKKRIEVELIEGGPRVLPLLRPEASEKAQKRLEKLGVTVILGSLVRECFRNIIVLDTGERAADILIWTAGSKNAEIFAKYPEIFEIEDGKVKVDTYLRVPKAQEVFILGDNASTPYSGMAQTAIYDAVFVVRHLLAEVVNNKKPSEYKAIKPTYAVPIGKNWAVVDQNGRISSGRIGWLKRRRADTYILKNFEPYKKAFASWHGKQKG